MGRENPQNNYILITERRVQIYPYQITPTSNIATKYLQEKYQIRGRIQQSA